MLLQFRPDARTAGNMVPDGRDGTFDRLNKRSRDLERQIMNTRAQTTKLMFRQPSSSFKALRAFSLPLSEDA